MLMEFQGKKATHDFLSLYTKDPSFPAHQDSRPPSQGFYLKTHDFLKPLETAEGEAEPAPERPGAAAGPTASVAHVLPGGIGTYSISHVARNGSVPAVKPERVTCARGPSVERKPEPDSERAASGYGSYAGVAFTLWEANAKDRAQWPATPLAARTTASLGSLSSSRNRAARDKKRFMESGSRSSRGFDEEDEDDDEFGKREGTSKKRELTVRVDGKSGGNDQRGAPRSKHSATEQRRRSKINDRFQILRELIPHGDQKRDKASFLLEVIEYIQFLQEKVQKNESSYPGFNEENAKLMPWNNNLISGDGNSDPSQVIKNGPSQGFIYPVDDNSTGAARGVLSTAQNPIESDMNAGVSYKPLENPVGFTSKAGSGQPSQRLISDIDNLASQSLSQWLRPSDYSANCDLMSDQEELTIDEGTISLSTAYSQNMLNTLNQALESSGIDLSQAHISVQINLGKRAAKRRAAAITTMSNAKDPDDPSLRNRPVIGHSRVGSSGEESEKASKRHKLANS